MIPSNIQDKVRAVISNSGGEVPATQFPGMYADRWRQPFDFVRSRVPRWKCS